MGSQKSSSSTGRGSAQGSFENSRNSSLPATVGPHQELAPATQRTVSFTEIKFPSSSQSTAPVFHPDLVIRKGSLILEISNSASDELLSRIGGSWMLNNATGFRKIYIAAGYTDLRRGIDGLASIVKFNFQLDPYDKDILFLFCGRRSDRIKGLVWEGDGFLLLYKGWSLAVSAGPVQKKRRWRSHRNNIRR